MHALKNTHRARLCFYKAKYFFGLSVINLLSSKSDVNGLKKEVLMQKWNKHIKN